MITLPCTGYYFNFTSHGQERPTRTRLAKLRNVNRLIIGHINIININSLRNKFETLKDCIRGNADTLSITETKLGESLRIGQFQIEGFSTPEVPFYFMLELEKKYHPN